ncbi:MAG: hypothetical protein JST43_13560 [Bacteroidetes bacterium]|nr:hypothetical protein [Bacteroidota bacterium]MBS1539798.1 hypothetical protein [Bacteroidota bacterium]
MKEITIEVNGQRAMKLIKNLEELQLIRILKNKYTGTNSKDKKLSERLAGSVTKVQAQKMDKELKKMRQEWQRNF